MENAGLLPLCRRMEERRSVFVEDSPPRLLVPRGEREKTRCRSHSLIQLQCGTAHLSRRHSRLASSKLGNQSVSDPFRQGEQSIEAS